MNQMYYDLCNSSDSPINDRSILTNYKVRFYDEKGTVASFEFDWGYPVDIHVINWLYPEWVDLYDYELDEL